jgi:hypothetical protein
MVAAALGAEQGGERVDRGARIGIRVESALAGGAGAEPAARGRTLRQTYMRE